MGITNWKLLGLSALLVLAGQTCAWIQFNTQFKYPKYGPEWWGWYVVAIPSTWFFLKSAQYGVAAMGGSLWANRFLGFTMGIIVYAVLTNYFFQQPITTKIGIQIGLALCVMMVQIFMK